MNKIPTSQLGPTRLTVTKLGLGLAALGRPGYINIGHSRDLSGRYAPADLESLAHEVLDAAWNAGVRYFDAARSYGRGEEFLGSWLNQKKLEPDDVGVSSKWGYTYTANWQVKAEKHEVKEHTLPVLQRQWKESRANLNGFLGLYQIHSATLESGVLDRQDVLEELARIRDKGIYIGLSLSGAQQAETLEKALDIRIGEFPLFSTVQATWNILEPSIGPLLALAHNSGMGIILKEVLANGRLTSRNTRPEFEHKREMLEREAEVLETTIEALSIAVALSQPWADVILSGAANVDHLLENLQAFDVPVEQIDKSVLESLKEEPDIYWKTRSGLVWN